MKSTNDIAKKYNVSRKTVWSKALIIGCDMVGNQFIITPEEEEQIVKMLHYKSGRPKKNKKTT